jgi:hypothetical protein
MVDDFDVVEVCSKTVMACVEGLLKLKSFNVGSKKYVQNLCVETFRKAAREMQDITNVN